MARRDRGWAAEGAAVAWVGVRTARTPFQLRRAAAVDVRGRSSVRKPARSRRRRFIPILNARTFATALRGGGSAMPSRGARSRRATPTPVACVFVVHVLGSVLTPGWITAEIQSVLGPRATTPQAYLYEQVLLSLAWGVYGAVVIGVGMLRSYPPLRYIGMTVIALTSLKVFFYDLWELGGIYRVVGFITFGVLLVLVSYLYQKRRVPQRAAQSPPPPPLLRRHSHRRRLASSPTAAATIAEHHRPVEEHSADA